MSRGTLRPSRVKRLYRFADRANPLQARATGREVSQLVRRELQGPFALHRQCGLPYMSVDHRQKLARDHRHAGQINVLHRALGGASGAKGKLTRAQRRQPGHAIAKMLSERPRES